MRKILKVLVVLFVLVIAVYLSFQIYNVVYPAYSVEIAGMYTVSDSIDFYGIAVRDETIVDNSAVGILNYRVNDGDKIATDSVVADIYPSTVAARNMASLAMYEDELRSVQAASESASFVGVNLDSMSDQIFREMIELSGSIYDNNLAGFDGNRLSAFEVLSGFYFATGSDLDYSAQLSSLESRVAGLSERMMQSGEIIAPVGGYFVSYTDGYEGKVNKETLLGMSVAEVEALANDEAYRVNNNACKVISDYTWYFAALVDKQHESRFYLNQTLTVDFSYALIRDVPATIIDIKSADDSGKILLIFECEYLNSDMTSLRLEEGEISFRNYKGIRVPRTALRVLDDTVGVFTKYDSKVEFKAIDIIFETESYVLVEPSLRQDYLNLYDQVIVEGKDLYVGKTLN